MDAKKYKGRLHRSLQAMFIVPLFILGIIITFFSFFTVRSAMYNEVQTELKNTADAVITIYDLLYPGDYRLEGETAFDLYKGNQVITSDYTVIDRLSADASIDITLFYHDTRILTTIRDTDGNRIIGTGADDRIIQEVFWAERPQFYYNATINKVNYFAYYTPLRNSNGAVIGMIYTGKPRSEVDKSVMHAVLPTLVVTLLGVLVVSFVSSTYAHRLTSTLRKIRNFFSKVAAGNQQGVCQTSFVDASAQLLRNPFLSYYILEKHVSVNIFLSVSCRRCRLRLLCRSAGWGRRVPSVRGTA